MPPDDAHSPTSENVEFDHQENGASGSESEDEETDPSSAWRETHTQIKATISELGNSVMPKLNWSAPKDATWISATNSMECREPNDIYLLLKSSDFIVHDLEQAFDGCAYAAGEDTERVIPYHLVLRKTVQAYNPSMEFRCFVRDRGLLCVCQRDLNHYDFLPQMIPQLRSLIQDFLLNHLAKDFPDPNFAFDVYIPQPYTRVWLIDINPWAPRTDPLLFSWLEILEMAGPDTANHEDEDAGLVVEEDEESDGLSSEGSQDMFTPELRLVNRDDPEAYSFNTQQYSAHKLPKDVVDAGVDGEAGLREFMGRWREIVRRQEDEIVTRNDVD